MTFWNGVKKNLDQTVRLSKHLLTGAGKKTKDLKDVSVLKLEIRNLRSKRKNAEAQLGSVVYNLFLSERQSITRSTPDIKILLEQLVQQDEQIAEKEAELGKYDI